MKQLSIKANVTIWYTSLLVIVLSLILIFILNISDNYMLSKAKSNLKDIVISNAEEIQVKSGVLDLTDLENFDSGVNIIVHNLPGNLLFGRYPTGFPEKSKWTNGGIETISLDGKQWIVYDHLVKSPDYEDILVRGIASVDALSQTISIAAISALLLFPIIILIAAFGGYQITRKAFQPVKQIADAASEINSGNDLTRRIGLEGSGDEIISLANTFDSMFDRLQKSFEHERQFSADASHELRTPTSVIMAQCESTIDEINKNELINKEELERSLSIILQQSKKMSSLISQLLFLSKIDNGENILNIETFDLSDLASMIVAELSSTSKNSDIEIISEIAPNIIVDADQTLITRMLINLISNGIKYGKKDGFVKIVICENENSLEGKVIDNGIGISEDNINKIWDRFYQVNPARTSESTTSMGFGLSMVKWIVEIHAGTVKAESTIGSGSSFIFSMPIINNSNLQISKNK